MIERKLDTATRRLDGHEDRLQGLEKRRGSKPPELGSFDHRRQQRLPLHIDEPEIG